MNSKIIIGVIAVVVLVGGFLYWKSIQVAQAPVTSEAQQNTTTPSAPAGGGMQSMRDLLALGTSQKCTFVNEVDGSKSEGAVYVSGGKVRGDFVSRVDAAGKTIMSHMITDGNEMRMWQDGETMGYLMKTPQGAAKPAGDTAKTNGAPDLENKTEYSCAPWAADSSVFVPPSTIMFHSMEDMMKMGGAGDAGMQVEGMEPMNMDMGAAGGGVETKELQCRTCDGIKDAASKAQCKAAFECQ